jgi:mRNA interferase MazF
MHPKDFTTWQHIKQQLDLRDTPPLFKPRKIWWRSIGVNVGYEVFGKGEAFARPVLVIDKHNQHSFFGLPLGSTRKPNKKHFSLSILMGARAAFC